MGPLERNLEAIRATSPALVSRLDTCARSPEANAVRAASGAYTLRVGERLEASAQDPEAEGRSLADLFIERASCAGATRMVVFGLGVHTLSHLDRFDGEILVIEPSLSVARGVLEHVDLAPMLRRASLIVADDMKAALGHPLFSSTERGVFVAHPSARRRAPKLHEQLAQRFHAGGAPEALDIAVVPPLYGGSLPIAHACARALRELGHNVRELDLQPFLAAYREIVGVGSDLRLQAAAESLRESLVRLIGELIVARFRTRPPDLVFALAQAPLDPLALEALRSDGITTAFWFCEDFRVMTYWRGLARAYDAIFHVQPDDFAEPLREAGGYGVPLSMAFDPGLHRPVELSPSERERYGHPLSFLGAGYLNRIRFLPGLFDLGLRVYGTGWPEGPPYSQVMPEPNRRQSTEESNRIFNASEVNLNLHSSPWCDGVNPAGDYLNPRTFELAGAGAFQLTDERGDLGRHFQPGREIETFSDLSECRRKAAHFLAHPDERREIAAAGRARALSEHTYAHRMRTAVEALRSCPAPVSSRRASARSVQAVLAQAREEPGLASVLSRLDAHTEVDADAIQAAVSLGSGDLSREEKLLVFMKECLGEVQVLNEAGDAA